MISIEHLARIAEVLLLASTIATNRFFRLPSKRSSPHVHLFLHVKAPERSVDDHERCRMGLEFPKG